MFNKKGGSENPDKKIIEIGKGFDFMKQKIIRELDFYQTRAKEALAIKDYATYNEMTDLAKQTNKELEELNQREETRGKNIDLEDEKEQKRIDELNMEIFKIKGEIKNLEEDLEKSKKEETKDAGVEHNIFITQAGEIRGKIGEKLVLLASLEKQLSILEPEKTN